MEQLLAVLAEITRFLLMLSRMNMPNASFYLWLLCMIIAALLLVSAYQFLSLFMAKKGW